MSAPLVIVIPGRPPTPNDRGKQGAQWAMARKWKEVAWQVADRSLPEGWRPLERCRLLVEFIVHDRRERDWDNLIASSKPLTDGLVEADVLVDDSNAVIESVTFRITVVTGVQATVYHFEPLELDQVRAGLRAASCPSP